MIPCLSFMPFLTSQTDSQVPTLQSASIAEQVLDDHDLDIARLRTLSDAVGELRRPAGHEHPSIRIPP